MTEIKRVKNHTEHKLHFEVDGDMLRIWSIDSKQYGLGPDQVAEI